VGTAASRDLDIPLTLLSELDYTTTFASQGQETLMMLINEDFHFVFLTPLQILAWIIHFRMITWEFHL